MARVLANIHQHDLNESNKILKHVYDKVYDLVDVYCSKSKELILDIKALAYGKIKGKSINAKHICLLSNCLSVIKKIVEDIFEP